MTGELFALYDEPKSATEALARLESCGVASGGISVVAGASPTQAGRAAVLERRFSDLRPHILRGGARVVAGGPLGSMLDEIDRLHIALTARGMPSDRAELYAEAVRRGGVLLLVGVTESQHETAKEAMQAGRPVDVEETSRAWAGTGSTALDPDAPGYSVKALESEVQQTLPMEARRREVEKSHDRARIGFMRGQVKYGQRPAGESGVGDQPPTPHSTKRDRVVQGRDEEGPRTLTDR